MAGVKGRSGGARPNTGPKPREPQLLDIPVPVGDSLAHSDPKVFLLALMNDLEADVKLRADAAKALMPFMHERKDGAGKKEQRQQAAEKVAGRFSAGTPPKLVAAGGRKV